MRKLEFDAIGTHWSIETPKALKDELRSIILERIAQFDVTYSRFRDDSIVGKMARSAGEYTFPSDCLPLVSFYRDLYDATDGAVTPLIGSALVESGYDKEYSFLPGAIHDIPNWDDAMQWNGTTVLTTAPVTFDVGAAGKGYLVDIIGEILEVQNVQTYTIDASGDIRCRGQSVQRIGMENPYDPTLVVGVMNLLDASLCASATNRRAWGEGMHHVIDARSTLPVRDIVATWAMASSTMVADGLATALFFTDGDELAKHWQFDYARLMADGTLAYSSPFVGELFI